MTDLDLLPGVPESYVRERFERSPGNELAGKFTSPVSSAALAANCFAWFHHRPELLPPLPGVAKGFHAARVEIEYKAAFPWSGGHHPWLDAAILDGERIIGIESKRYEPFRGRKTAPFSDAYDRPVWGNDMGPVVETMNRLKSGDLRFEFLDAAQLVKHAFGLVTEAERTRLAPTLFYLFAEPVALDGRAIGDSARQAHRNEIEAFAAAVDGAAVSFMASSYREWIETWDKAGEGVRSHGQALVTKFGI